MKPLDPTLPLDELLARARVNVAQFDRAAFLVWLRQQSEDIRRVARKVPPNVLWQIQADDGQRLYGVVAGYQAARRGMPPMPRLVVLGIQEGAGSPSDPVALPLDVLTRAV